MLTGMSPVFFNSAMPSMVCSAAQAMPVSAYLLHIACQHHHVYLQLQAFEQCHQHACPYHRTQALLCVVPWLRQGGRQAGQSMTEVGV